MEANKKSAIENLFGGLNSNMIVLVAGFAMLYWLGGVFLTKENYYRDQRKFDETIIKFEVAFAKLELAINKLENQNRETKK